MTTAPPPSANGWPPSAAPSSPPSAPVPRRRMSPRAKSGWLIALCVFWTIGIGGILSGEESILPAWLRAYIGFGAFVMTCASVTLAWRSRWPVRISLVLSLLTIVIPTTPLPALIALPVAVAATEGGRRWSLIFAAYVATAVSCTWDVLSSSSFLAAFIRAPDPGTSERLVLFWVVPVVAALLVTPFAANGITRRLKAERDAAQRDTEAAEQNVTALHREVQLEHHRQELARELHDTLAANLSTLSLHAGALELTVESGDDRAKAAARVVRESAQNSLDDLRQVVRELRNPALPAGTGSGLAEIPALIDEALRTGVDVRVQMFVSDAAACDSRVAHAVYRLVQESITNARRHAPGMPLHLDLRGGPGLGLTVRTTNWLPAAGAPSSSPGGGNGLVGMAERVDLIGGTFHAGTTTEGAFAMTAWLPWVPKGDQGA